MGSNLHDVYYCQFARTEELNERHYKRNLANRQMNPKYLSHPVSNRRVVMPVVDDVKKSKVQKGTFSDFNLLIRFFIFCILCFALVILSRIETFISFSSFIVIIFTFCVIFFSSCCCCLLLLLLLLFILTDLNEYTFSLFLQHMIGDPILFDFNIWPP